MFSKIKEELKPSKETEEKIEEIKREIIQKLEKKGYKAISTGSTARGTYLPEEPDIDIFFFFSIETSREELEKKGIEIGKEILKEHNPETHYAEHPYVKARVKGIDIDLVPCYEIKKYENKEDYKIDEELLSAVDRTPLHNQYLQEKMKEEQKIEVKLLKKFLKNIGCYGANEKTRGFSGYTTELLILRYDTFRKTIESASEWKRNHKIDIERHGKKDFKDPLIIIDPIDPNRNAAAALSEEKLGRFIIKSRKLLKDPTVKNFESKVKINKEMIKEKKILLLEFPYPKKTIPEIGWSQLRKLEKQLTKKLNKNEFKVYRTTHWTDEKTKAQIILEVRNKKLPRYKKHIGPPFYNKKHSENFLNEERNKEIYIDRNRICSSREREHKDIKKAINAILDSKEVPSRYREPVKKTEIIEEPEKLMENKEIIREYFRI